jgi:hypothetical protein
MPVTVAQAERSFSCLSRTSDVLKSTATQNRLTDLGLLSLEAELAIKRYFSKVTDFVCEKKSS